MAPRYFDINALVVNGSDWTAVVAPIACSRIVIQNPGAGSMFVRVVANGPKKKIGPDDELDIHAAVECFEAGTWVCELQTAGEVGSAVVTFTR